APRGRDWPRQIGAQGAALIRKFKKPVISDEPIGAADTAVTGRRDNDPGRFRASAQAAARAGLGATFHYEGGLQARLPTGVEQACLRAWLGGLPWAKRNEWRRDQRTGVNSGVGGIGFPIASKNACAMVS